MSEFQDGGGSERVDGDRLAVHLERTLAGLEDLQDADAFFAIGARGGARGDALEEVGAFGTERFEVFEGDGRGLRFGGGQSAVFEFDALVVQAELVIGPAVLEDGHLVASNDNETLFLVRV